MRGPRVLPVLSKEPQDGGELSELGDAVAQGDNGNVQGSSRSSSPEGGAAYYDGGGESPARPRTLEPLGRPKAETAGAEDRKEGERKAQSAGRAPPEPAAAASPPFTPFSSPGGKPRMLQKMGTSTMLKNGAFWVHIRGAEQLYLTNNTFISCVYNGGEIGRSEARCDGPNPLYNSHFEIRLEMGESVADLKLQVTDRVLQELVQHERFAW